MKLKCVARITNASKLPTLCGFIKIKTLFSIRYKFMKLKAYVYTIQILIKKVIHIYLVMVGVFQLNFSVHN